MTQEIEQPADEGMTELRPEVAPEEPGAVEEATSPDEPGSPGLETHELSVAQLEGLLFVAERPLARAEIATLAGVARDVVDARIGDLEVSLAERGIRLVASGDSVELTTAPEAGRLSGPSLETRASVAYRQPCTRATIERIRGVDSDYTLRALLHRRLIVELGRSEAPGRPILYGTGFDFLERFGLVSLEELPRLEAAIAARVFDSTGEYDMPDSDGIAPGKVGAAREADG